MAAGLGLIHGFPSPEGHGARLRAHDWTETPFGIPEIGSRPSELRQGDVRRFFADRGLRGDRIS